MDNQQIRQTLASQLAAFVENGGVEPKQGYFIRGDIELVDGDESLRTDEAQDYCYDCAKGIVETYRQRHQLDELEDGPQVCDASLDGEDSCAHCTKCGALLDYQLNETGVVTELQHFEEHLHEKTPLTPDDAWHIARILDASDDADVIKLGERAVSMIPPASPAAPVKSRSLRP